MRFDDPIGKRADLALELLEEGKSVIFRDLGLRLPNPDTVECRVFSQWSPENINRAIAVGEIDASRRTFSDLVRESSAYRAVLGARTQLWELLFDYGNGAIRVCRVRDGELAWDVGFPKRE